ncbi:DUF1178 family protein [Limnohabitans sp.]|uniref:DUF1178 family protein n=1 Tax=Limnohabitans sp. TaxID=1907725 RepID=UPI00286ECAA7|nr:DUF1178 family protein [Limnohabitans sp.]
MKVLDLQCGQHHVFEGWFGSEEDFQSQLARGLVTCPMCGDASVTKKLSAPRLNLSTTRGEPETAARAASNSVDRVGSHQADTAPASTPASPTLPSLQEVANLEPAQLQAALLKMVRHVVANTENVGSSFPEEARKMHYGEAEQRNIRGHATPEETEELIDEGIAVMPLPLPDALKEPLQ